MPRIYMCSDRDTGSQVSPETPSKRWDSKLKFDQESEDPERITTTKFRFSLDQKFLNPSSYLPALPDGT
ncbi:hypothetical protein Pmani_022938 [Petrolisthes manimaculis]|uniref:Uncharacterized protein n=1 Tax=Petrolisthes manimaculis TaxID=1843537 RepID=A0AAE1U0P4_9EUCA|nr:hypothetical protein Pmani_022938 [Petrolisthes manimaculis]